jgi:4-amino-4-deoxy-L-arabinose transferase-like glycosyltransferase
MVTEAEPLPPRRRHGFEIALVVLVSLLVLAPGIERYSLVDPWETHYGEVARRMLQDHDLVHTDWSQDEGFRSKPVFTFWLMAAGMKAMGVANDGGYSGEMVASARTMIAIRLPFILCAIAGLTMMWWMLARLVSRRLAWLALLVVGSCPFFCLVARQGIPDMPCVACLMGALAMFTMAVEDGDRPISVVGHIRLGRWRIAIDARHVILAIVGGFVVAQAAYYCGYFIASPGLAIRGRFPTPAVWLPFLMLVYLGASFNRDIWFVGRLIPILLGGIIAAIVNEPMPKGPPGRSWWRVFIDDFLVPWERHAVDRYILRAIVFAFIPLAALNGTAVVMMLVQPAPMVALSTIGAVTMGTLGVWVFLSTRQRANYWPLATWRGSGAITDKLLAMSPLTNMRQIYMLWCYALLGVSILAKGPPALAVAGLVGFFYVLVFWRWRALYDGKFEIKRGLLLMLVVSIPWHVAMFFKDGIRFIDEYLVTHILNRAAVGVDNSPGTFEYYTSQLGHGMWLWAALAPAAVTAALLRSRIDTRAGRVKIMMSLWAICGVFFFSFVQTKFHHYILPAVPALAILVAFFLDDLLAGRERLHPMFAAIAIGITLLITRDLMHEPERWIEMFVFRYDRPWPAAEPWAIEPSDSFLVLGIAGVFAIAVATRFARIGVGLLCIAGLAICIFALQTYMPIAGKHWGMRDALRTYYQQRSIYGEKLVYFGPGEVVDELTGAGDHFTFETFVPDTLQLGQPLTVKIQLNKASDERIMDQDVTLVGTATEIGEHDVAIALAPGERAKLDPLLADCQHRIDAYPALYEQYEKRLKEYEKRREANPQAKEEPPKPPEPLRGRHPIKVVDADRLIAWQLYWRGENFWSGDEIWGWLPDMKTAFVKTDNVEWNKFINDRTRAPLGRRYFLVTEGGRIMGVKGMLPTQRGRDSFEVLDTTSNKFSLAAFWL